MKTLLATLSVIAIVATAGVANAGPCTTGATKQLSEKTDDAGSGPTPGAAAQAPQPQSQEGATNGTKVTGANPEQSGTKLMNDTLAGKAAFSQDVQKQIQGQPTAAEQAAGAKPDC